MSGTRLCITQMRGPASRQGALQAPLDPLLRRYFKTFFSCATCGGEEGKSYRGI